MRYMGGKSRIAKQLAEVIDRVRKPGQLVWDPFCGGLSMAVALSKNGPVWATDVNVALINLYRAVQSGWVPPTEVSRETYQAAKSLPDTDPFKGFCAVACSFAGKWFGGYALSGSRNYALNARRSLAEVTRVQRLDCGDFLSVQPQHVDAVLYLDPPYRGTTSYAGAPPFDHDLLVSRVRDWALYTHVFVSEYDLPVGRIVWERAQTTTVARDKSAYAPAVERLYYLGPNQ
jgi:DNA adenine methylase